MKLGIFCLNVSGGTTMTSAPGTLTPTWEENRRVARAADRAGWEFLLPLGRWKGAESQLNFQGRSFEVFTWASGIAACTQQIQVFATCHVPIWHPVMAAKASTTVDHVSHGRFGLNVVAGWNEDELAMFNVPNRPHDERYEAADEWTTILKRLWTEHGPFDVDGKFHHIKAAYSEPKPIQKPYPVVVNAGQSATGQHYGAKHADFSFQGLPDWEAMKALVTRTKALAWEEYRRKLGIIVPAPMVCRDTEKEVREYVKYYVDELGDWEGARRRTAKMVAGGSQSASDEMYRRHVRDIVAGGGSQMLFGTPEQIVDNMLQMAGAGIDGIALSWVDYEAGVEAVNEKILPLMEQAGLRQPASTQG